MTFVIDCITSPSIDSMRASGVSGLCRYLSWTDSRDNLGKVIHKVEYDRLMGGGFTAILNWEYAATDWLGGAGLGATHATEAVRQARALGYPAGMPIPGSADFDMTLSQWNAAGKPYATAYAAGIRAGGYRPGVYGPYDVLAWCHDAGIMDWFWQAGMSTAWSGGRNASLWQGAHLRQRRHVTVGGIDCDYNDIVQSNYAGGSVVLSDTDAAYLIWRVEALAALRDTVAGGPEMGHAFPAGTAVKAINTKLDALTAAVASIGTLSSAAIDELAAKLATALVVSPTNPLDDGYHAAIRADLKQALREGVG